MSGFSTDAILLRKIEYGDHDFIVSFFSRSNGKISVMAKNAKKSVKRFSGALDLFGIHHVQCTFPKKKDALINLTQAELENGFMSIRYDVLKTGYASYWSELIYFWMEEGRPQDPLYDLLAFSLKTLDKGRMDAAVLSLLFQIRFMGLSGFLPNITGCGICKKGLDEMEQDKVWFDFSDGRLVCSHCKKEGAASKGMMVTKGTLKQLTWINRAGRGRTERIKFSGLAIKEGEQLLESFIPFHIGRHFNSLAFLKQLRKTP